MSDNCCDANSIREGKPQAPRSKRRDAKRAIQK
jgi:hypothetical protein